MEFIGVGDIHLDKLEKIIPNGNKLIANEIRKPLNYAVKNGIENVIFYGDIRDPLNKPLSLDAHKQFLEVLLAKKYRDLKFKIILGNHDWNETGDHSLVFFDFVTKIAEKKNIEVITLLTDMEIEGVSFRFLPFPEKKTHQRKVNIGHFDALGGIRDNGRKIKEGVDTDHFCCIGHLHTPHRVRNMHFSGTLYQTNFGESLPKGFHHVKVDVDLNRRVRIIPNDPSFKLFNLEIWSRKDLKKISDNKLYLYKLFIQDGVRIEPDDLLKYPNVTKINRFKDESDLTMQLEEEWKVDESVGNVFQPDEDVKEFLSTKNVDKELKKRTIKLHGELVKKFLSQEQ